MSLPEYKEFEVKTRTFGTDSIKLDGDVMDPYYDRPKEETRVFDFTTAAQLPKKHISNSHWHRHTFERPRRKVRQ